MQRGPVGGMADGAEHDPTDSKRQLLYDKFRDHIRETKPRVPKLHESSEAELKRQENEQQAELKLVLENPRVLPPYTPPEEEHITSQRQPLPTDALQVPPRGSALPPQRVRRSRAPYAVRYRKYQKCLTEFKEQRKENRVRKLQRVVYAGLATEHAYMKELARLNIDPADHPLPFKPNAYLRNDSSATIRSFLMTAVQDDLMGDAERAQYSAVEGLISEDMGARQQWMEAQEQVTRLLGYFKRMEGQFGPAEGLSGFDFQVFNRVMRDALYFESLRNLLARRSAFYAAHRVDLLSPHTVTTLNRSLHGRLFAAFGGGGGGGGSHPSLAQLVPVSLAPPPPLEGESAAVACDEHNAAAMPSPDSDAFEQLLASRSMQAFWQACAVRHAALKAAGGGGDEPQADAPTEVPVADGGESKQVFKTRSDWLQSEQGAWEMKRREFELLKAKRRERAAEKSPDYEMVYSLGDMGEKPEKDSFNLHPSARMAYRTE
eukprot:TRINITY_DN2322_c0_g2_i1.p1 TRINITY_DN2322_c0_g2~~TRINITY_DN2322_c0_g2_i1.p1  ORF type:complete len:534 (+),score=164.04 TRINITY_DN2322_c0_g2_i1:138-1604(+)